MKSNPGERFVRQYVGYLYGQLTTNWADKIANTEDVLELSNVVVVKEIYLTQLAAISSNYSFDHH